MLTIFQHWGIVSLLKNFHNNEKKGGQYIGRRKTPEKRN